MAMPHYAFTEEKSIKPQKMPRHAESAPFKRRKMRSRLKGRPCSKSFCDWISPWQLSKCHKMPLPLSPCKSCSWNLLCLPRVGGAQEAGLECSGLDYMCYSTRSGKQRSFLTNALICRTGKVRSSHGLPRALAENLGLFPSISFRWSPIMTFSNPHIIFK